jgi:membrane associated rhomboid family serine protease
MADFERRKTWMTYLLIAANITAFGAELYYMQQFGQDFLQNYILSLSALSEGNYRVLLSHAFLHAGVAHLASNMVGLYLFGKPYERSVGAIKMLFTYLAASIAGGLLTIGVSPETSLLGASGGVFGIMAGAMLLDPGESLMEQVPMIRRFSLPIVRNLFSVVFFAAIYFLANALNAFDFSSQIAYLGHVGGFVMGGALTYWWKPRESSLGFKIFVPFLALIAAVSYFQPGSRLYWYALGSLVILLVLVRFVSRRTKRF